MGIEFTQGAEMTAATTNIGTAVITVLMLVAMSRSQDNSPTRRKLWLWLFACLTAAMLLGALVHGVVMTEVQKRMFWGPLLMALYGCASLLTMASLYEFNGRKSMQRQSIFLIAISLLLVVFSVVNDDIFALRMPIFFAFTGVCLIIVLIIQLYLAFGKKVRGSLLLVAACLLQIAGGAILAFTDLQLQIGPWLLNAIGIDHLFVGLSLFLFLAAYMQLRKRPVAGV